MSRSTRFVREPLPAAEFVTLLESRVLLSAIAFHDPAYYAAGVRTPPGVGAEHLAAGDFTNDGVADLLVVGSDIRPPAVAAHWVRVLAGVGDGTFGPPIQSPGLLPPVTSSVAVADFNRDGNLDAVVTEDDREAMVHVLLGNGDGTFRHGEAVFSGANSRDVAVADFNGDGKLDLAVANAAPWTPWLSLAPPMHGFALLPGNGDGTFRAAQLIDSGRRPQHFVEAGDVSYDGQADLVFGQVVFGPGDFVAPESRVWAFIGHLSMSTRPDVMVAGAITGMKLADLNADGALDVAASAMRDLMSQGAVAVTVAGVPRSLGLFDDPRYHELQTVIATDLAVADFNADGRPDLAIAGEDPRWGRPMPVPAVITLENRGGGAFGAAQFHPLPADVSNPGKLTTGFFNRDPLPDVAVALPGSNQVGVLLNNSKAVFATPTRLRAAPPTFATRPLARFTVTGARPSADAFRVTINWGDGTRGAGSVIANPDGSFSVLGSHTYRRASHYRVAIAIEWEGAVKRVSTLVRVGPTTVR